MAGEFHLQYVTVLGLAHEHGLATQQDALLATGEYLLHHVARLRDVVFDHHVARSLARFVVRVENFRKAPRRFAHQGVRRIQDRLHGTVVLLQGDDVRGSIELPWKFEDVVDPRGAERVDGLRVIANHAQAAAIRLQGRENLRLQAVGILVFVHQHVVEALAHRLGAGRILHEQMPVEQQVVVVQQQLPLLGLDVSAKQSFQLRAPLRAPWILVGQGVLQGSTAIHAVRVNRQAGVLAWKSFADARASLLVAQHVEQVCGITAIQHGEVGTQAQRTRVAT